MGAGEVINAEILGRGGRRENRAVGDVLEKRHLQMWLEQDRDAANFSKAVVAL